MAGKAALEAELPELGEPRVASVSPQPELQEVVIEGGDLGRLQLDRDASHRLLLEALHHLHSVRPAVTAERVGKRIGKMWSYQLEPFWAKHHSDVLRVEHILMCVDHKFRCSLEGGKTSETPSRSQHHSFTNKHSSITVVSMVHTD